MPTKDLEKQVYELILEHNFEAVRALGYDLIFESLLLDYTDEWSVENWQKMRSLLLHEDERNQALGLELMEAGFSAQIKLNFIKVLEGYDFPEYTRELEMLRRAITAQQKTASHIETHKKAISGLEQKIKAESNEDNLMMLTLEKNKFTENMRLLAMATEEGKEEAAHFSGTLVYTLERVIASVKEL